MTSVTLSAGCRLGVVGVGADFRYVSRVERIELEPSSTRGRVPVKLLDLRPLGNRGPVELRLLAANVLQLHLQPGAPNPRAGATVTLTLSGHISVRFAAMTRATMCLLLLSAAACGRGTGGSPTCGIALACRFRAWLPRNCRMRAGTHRSAAWHPRFASPRSSSRVERPGRCDRRSRLPRARSRCVPGTRVPGRRAMAFRSWTTRRNAPWAVLILDQEGAPAAPGHRHRDRRGARVEPERCPSWTGPASAIRAVPCLAGPASQNVVENGSPTFAVTAPPPLVDGPASGVTLNTAYVRHSRRRSRSPCRSHDAGGR